MRPVNHPTLLRPTAIATDTAGRQTPDEIFNRLRDIIIAAETLMKGFHHRLPSMDGNGLTPFALRAVQAAGRRGLSQVELARQLEVSASATTRLVDALEKADVLRRMPHPTDRRLKMVVLTPTGEATVEAMVSDLTAADSPLRLLDGEHSNHFRAQLFDISTIASRLLHASQPSRSIR